MNMIARARAALGFAPDPVKAGIANAIWNEREGIRLADRPTWDDECDTLDILMREQEMVLPSGRRIAVEPTRKYGVTTFTAFSSTGIPATFDQSIDEVVMKAWTTAFVQAVAREIEPTHPICFATGPSKGCMKSLSKMVEKAIDAAAPLRVRQGHVRADERKEPTRHVVLGEGIEILTGQFRTTFDQRRDSVDVNMVLIRHPRFGTLRFHDENRRIGNALKRAPMRAVTDTYRPAGTIALPSAPTGNARAAGILRLCAQALAIDPDMSDPAGGRIAPLVHEHLPRLLKRHAQASIGAASSDLARIDADLDEGLELVRAGVERSLASVKSERRDALATELKFLRARHPSERPFD